jgi:hypothetical protein
LRGWPALCALFSYLQCREFYQEASHGRNIMYAAYVHACVIDTS